MSLNLTLGQLASAEVLSLPRQPTNPYQFEKTPGPQDKIYSIQMRVLGHKQKKASYQLLEHLTRSAEIIFSQCEGVVFKIQTAEIEKQKKAFPGGEFFSPIDGKLVLTQTFFEFFSPFMASRKANSFDVHLVDRMDEGATTSGQAMVPALLNKMLEDPRPMGLRNIPPVEVAGYSVVLAMKSFIEGRVSKTGSARSVGDIVERWIETNHSLLAHELGHILLETQSGDGIYKDHFCPGLNDFCEEDNLMTGGGYRDREFVTDKTYKKVTGYSPLPAIEKAQCEALKNHPAVSVQEIQN